MALSGIEAKALPKNASLEHEEVVTKRYQARGYKVEKEVPVGEGKAIDLVARKGNESIAIEIETARSDIEGNMRKCKEAGFADVVVVFTKERHS